jgi:hypothetical protein
MTIASVNPQLQTALVAQEQGAVGSENVSLGPTATTRDITLELSAEIIPSAGGDQIVEVTVESVRDSENQLTVADISSEQQIGFGRPQLPLLRFDAVFDRRQAPRGAVIIGGTMAEYPFNPTITRVVTERVYDPTEPAYSFEQWFPTQPVKVNRLGSHIGTEGNQGQLVLYPAQVWADSPDSGVLRVFRKLELRILYEDITNTGDWQAPVIQQVTVLPGENQARVTAQVIDPFAGVGKPSGIGEVRLAYTTDGKNWNSILMANGRGTFAANINLPPGTHPGQLSFVVQASDNAGNVAYSSNKGEGYGGAEGLIYMPMVLKNSQ